MSASHPLNRSSRQCDRTLLSKKSPAWSKNGAEVAKDIDDLGRCSKFVACPNFGQNTAWEDTSDSEKKPKW